MGSKKMSARSISRDSRAISEHNYETPKLLPKSKFIKEKIPKMELIDYGYEPVGRPVTETQEDTEIKKEEEFGTVHHLSRENQSERNQNEKPAAELPSPTENQKKSSIFDSFMDKFRNKGDGVDGEKQRKDNDSETQNEEKVKREEQLKIKEMKDVEARKLKQEKGEEEKRLKKL